ncbi:acyl-CoA dehydrogenase [Mycolicibacterium sp. CH28]|uniref:acyl-CoA dehydrogenase family protein n=1 Tax=Mycolicibacterium sp. CH28 TaxID=2512237 RepID=UPI001080C8B6|nr:acyl-CoA dehydrogenase family protein [Mycolicibacterium sp. CH28]TGD87068.1 acyl-CoA dehydrogenase [Mycolicibacterium sp. CH28]
MSVTTVLAGGIFDTAPLDHDDHTGHLRDLVNQIGKRSFDLRLGHRGRPEQFDDTVWRQLEDTGLTRLTSDPDLDAGPAELAVVLYGLARYAVAVPIAETALLAAWLGDRSALSLPDAGPMTIAIGTADDANGSVSGTACDVPWAAASTVILIARVGEELRTGRLVDSDIRSGHNLAGELRESIRFTVPADQLRPTDEQTWAEVRVRGAWARCIQMMGALDATAALTVAHTRDRVQFGRPLSAFQSVQHALAAMAGQIEQARAAATLALAAADDTGFCSAQTKFAVTVAKVTIGRAAADVSAIAHQLHGAIGVTAEYPLWLFTTRLRAWSDEFGTTNEHAQRLGRDALSAACPWSYAIGNITT